MNPLPVLVSAAVVRKGSQILIAQRLPDSKNSSGKWEFPGGKVEFGETPEECVRREIKEELNIDISVHSLIGVSSHVYRTTLRTSHIVLICYLCDYISGELKCIEAADAKWILPSELGQFDLAAADLPLLTPLAEKLSRP